MLRSMLVVAMGLGLAAAAAAQETAAPAPTEDASGHHARLERSCAEVDGLSLCIAPIGAVPARLRPIKRRPTHFTRFTRLAGMFMGRVDAADIGPLKVRFNLEIR